VARPKIALIGGGNIGGTMAHLIAQKELADVVLLDNTEGLPQGKALDLMEGRPVDGYNVDIIGTNDYGPVKGSDVVIITAGVARKPGMSRDDLLEVNSKIMNIVAGNLKKSAKKAFVIVVSNPLDIMVYLCKKIMGIDRHQIVGMAGVLDSARFRAFVAMELNVSVKDVNALVLGGHGDTMVPLKRYCTVGGVPVEQFIPAKRLNEIVKRTQLAGGEIVGLLKTGSAFYSPAHAAVSMAEAVIKDHKRILPCAAYLQGEYGYKDMFLGVPVKLGAGGMEDILEVKLDANEKKLLKKSADHVKEMTKGL